MKVLLALLLQSSMQTLISHFSARKLAQSFRIAASTARRYLTGVLGMKCRHLRWVPHTLTATQKVVRVALAERVLQALAKEERSHFHFLFTGDEPWMSYAYNHWMMWVLSWDDVDEIERPSHFQQKMMFTIFVDGTRACKIAILPVGKTMNGTYFMECVLKPLTEVCYPEGRKSHKRRVMPHFDNAPIHNTDEVQGKLTNLGLTEIEHPPYNADLAQCDFFLFGVMKENLSEQRFESVESFSLLPRHF
jgi:hypothetical protein